MIKIIACSTSDITQKEAKELDITILPLTITFGETTYRDGIDITLEEFYDKLETSEVLPVTSQINPGLFLETMKPMLEAGDEIIVICLSSKLSATYNSAMIAATELNNPNIHIVDSKTVTFADGLLVREAVNMRNKGNMSTKEIVAELEILADKICLFAVVDTLKYLKLGGRLSGTSAAVGTLLGILPILEVGNGELFAIGKARGEKAAMKAIYKEIENNPPDLTKNIAMASSLAPEKEKNYYEHLKPLLKEANIISGNIGSVIGTHAGPKVVGIAYFKK